MEHELKILPQYFKAVQDGSKTFEFRKDDRDFEVGDTLILKEWDYDLIYKTEYGEESWGNPHYTGRSIKKEISYILRGGLPGCRVRKGLAILGLEQEGIVLKNIDLSNITMVQQVQKIQEEDIEFIEALENLDLDNAIEEFFDLMQARIGLLQKFGISVETIMSKYHKHLEKIKNRPRRED